jgi:hypothetical protein
MSAAKHTPGPWELREGHGPLTDQIVTSERAIATVWTRNFVNTPDERSAQPAPWAEGEANARLLLAAPALYDSLETLVDALTTGAGHDFIEAFVRDAKAALEEAAPGWNMLAEPSRAKLRALGQLRAAAPELLQALRETREFLISDYTGHRGKDYTGGALARIDAAIASATGSAA